MYRIIWTSESKIQTASAMMTVRELQALEEICKFGVNEPLSDSLAEAVQSLVCQSVNPLRGSLAVLKESVKKPARS